MSKVSELLNEFRLALDTTRERLAQTRDLSIENDILDLVERTVAEFVTALPQDLGHHVEPGASIDTLITRASSAVRENKDRFSKDAPVGFFSQRIEGLNQVLRDIGYLREGFGRGSGRPKPADMKWVGRGAVEGYVLNLMSYIVEELKTGDGAEVHRLRAEIDLDLFDARRGIVDLLQQDLDTRQFMEAAVDVARSQTGPGGWDAFRDLPYHSELEARSDFLVDVVRAHPPVTPTAGFFFEIAHPSRAGETIADLWLSGASHYEPNVEEWFADLDYTPVGGKLGSEILASIYRLAYTPGGLGNAADYTLCLAWAAYFARACAERFVEETDVKRIGCRVGFSGGDWIELGWIERT